MDGKKRNLEQKINKLLKLFPVVVILGARQCGKSTIAKMSRESWKYFDLENQTDFLRIEDDPTLFFRENSDHVIIDEAQRSPKLFETLRGVVDKDRSTKGRFILTGSASFELMKNISESLAGRAAVIELAPFKVNEFFDKKLPSFYDIFNSKVSSLNLDFLKGIKIHTEHSQMKEIFLKGGYPEPVISSDDYFHASWMENYFEQYINRDIRSLYPKLDIIKYRRIISMLSSLSGTIVNKADLARSVEIGEKSVKDYIDIIAGTYFWRSLPAFQTSKIKTMSKLPKGNFIDSGLALFLQNITTLEELNNYPALGRLFESFIVEEVIRGIQATFATNLECFHVRTKAGGEIDLLVQGSFGVVPIEIKYGSSTPKRKLKFLEHFIQLHNLPYAIVINNSERVEMLTEKIIQIPAGAI